MAVLQQHVEGTPAPQQPVGLTPARLQLAWQMPPAAARVRPQPAPLLLAAETWFVPLRRVEQTHVGSPLAVWMQRVRAPAPGISRAWAAVAQMPVLQPPARRTLAY